MFPIAASADPNKQKIEFYSWISNRSQTPPIVNTAPKIKLIRIPFLFISQLQGKAKSGCAIVNNNAFMVTSRGLMLKILSTDTFMLEKVCTGIELTNAVTR